MKHQKIERQLIPIVWVYALVVSLIIVLITGTWSYVVAFILGVATNLLAFTATIKQVDALLSKKLERPKTTFVVLNLLKTILFIVIMVIVALSYDYIHVFFTFFGLLSLKIVIYSKLLIIDKIFKKEKITVKEEVTDIDE